MVLKGGYKDGLLCGFDEKNMVLLIVFEGMLVSIVFYDTIKEIEMIDWHTDSVLFKGDLKNNFGLGWDVFD